MVTLQVLITHIGSGQGHHCGCRCPGYYWCMAIIRPSAAHTKLGMSAQFFSLEIIFNDGQLHLNFCILNHKQSLYTLQKASGLGNALFLSSQSLNSWPSWFYQNQISLIHEDKLHAWLHGGRLHYEKLCCLQCCPHHYKSL